MEYGFKKLIVWQKSIQLVKQVYALTAMFPASERFVLTDQLRRAVVSIPSNIAEGDGRASAKDYAHFLAIARGSLYETMTQLEIARQLGYIGECQEIEELADEVVRMLGTMLKKFGAIHRSPSTFAKQTESSKNHCSPSPSTFA